MLFRSGEFWNAKPLNEEVMRNGMKRLKKAAEFVAKKARSKCPSGTISRPMYSRGPYKGSFWTARDKGALKKSIRVVEKYGNEPGFYVTIPRGSLEIRVYSGTAKVYYAQLVEFYTPFMRPALEASKSQIKSILENG